MTNTHERKDKWYFLCNNWLSKDDGDGQISRLLLGTKSLDNVQSGKMYFLSVFYASFVFKITMVVL